MALGKAEQVTDQRKPPFLLTIPETPPQRGDLTDKVAEFTNQCGWSTSS
jgi:hypothetical protein